MSVIIKLKGTYIGETIMNIEEIKRAEASGFTIISKQEVLRYADTDNTICNSNKKWSSPESRQEYHITAKNQL